MIVRWLHGGDERPSSACWGSGAVVVIVQVVAVAINVDVECGAVIVAVEVPGYEAVNSGCGWWWPSTSTFCSGRLAIVDVQESPPPPGGDGCRQRPG